MFVCCQALAEISPVHEILFIYWNLQEKQLPFAVGSMKGLLCDFSNEKQRQKRYPVSISVDKK